MQETKHKKPAATETVAAPAQRRTRQLPASDAQLLEQCALFDVHRLGRALNAFYNAHLRGSGLTISQYTLLQNIAAMSPVGITQIAKAMLMERTSVTRLIEPLIKSNWVQTATGEDRRFRYVVVTPEGLDALANSQGAWLAAQRELLERVGPAQWRSLRVALRDTIDLVKDFDTEEQDT